MGQIICGQPLLSLISYMEIFHPLFFIYELNGDYIKFIMTELFKIVKSQFEIVIQVKS